MKLGSMNGLAALLPLGWAGSFCDAPGFAAEWQDEFDSPSLDTAKWTATTGAGSDGRDAYCLPANVALVDGALVLTSHRDATAVQGYNFTSGAVRTQGKVAFSPKDGTFRTCVRAKLPGHEGAAAGVWPAAWLMPESSACDPDLGEMVGLGLCSG